MTIRIFSISVAIALTTSIFTLTPVFAEPLPTTLPTLHAETTQELKGRLTVLNQDSKKTATTSSSKVFVRTQDKLLAAEKALLAITLKFDALTPKLQTLVASQSANSVVQSAFSDYQAKLADAKIQLASAQTTLRTLSATEFPGNIPTLSKVKTLLILAKHDMQQLITDTGNIKNASIAKKMQISESPNNHGK